MTGTAAMTPFCNAKTRRGTKCTRPAGWGTGHVGVGACKLHAGSTPAGELAGSRTMSLAFAKGALGAEVEIDPLSAMLLSVRLAAGQVLYWRLRLQADDGDTAPGLQDGYNAALQNLNRFSKAALDAGVDAKRVAIEERMAEAISLAAEDGLRELNLSPKQRAAFTRRFVAALADVEGTAHDVDP